MARSWSFEDVRDLNPADSWQQVSFLERLLELGATTEGQLVEFARLLELREGPFVAAFGQLPFDLGLGAVQIDAPGDRPGSTVELWAQPVQLAFDDLGRLRNVKDDNHSAFSHATITQLIGVIRLGVERARIHPLYVARLDNLKLLEGQLGDHMVENWMRLPETALGEPERRRRPLTGIDFQHDVATRARDHLVFATKALLNAYSVAALIGVRDRSYLYGYHSMLAPGRIAGAGAPTPVLKGLVDSASAPAPRCTSLGDLMDTVRSALRADDPFVRRLQALHSLCLSGEPELALVGTCTALEWLLNQRFPDLTLRTKNGETRSASIRAFLESRHSAILPRDVVGELRVLIEARNKWTHGVPPSHRPRLPTEAEGTLAQRALRLALETYRLVNLSAADTAA